MASIFGRHIAAPELSSLGRQPAVLAVMVTIVAILIVYAETAATIVSIWMRSETFAHGFIVVPIVGWLMWQRRAEVQAAVAKPFLPGLALVLLGGMAWVAATLSDVQAGRQFALVFMIESAILTIVGPAVVWAIAFPLAFLWFAVPFGEFMIPTMIDWTADFTVAALRASGIPVYREANHFVIPSGSWSVVEACSGVRYLIASTMVGALYASLSFTSARRKALFIAAAILVPIVANWMRAYGIVMLGHLSGNKIAVGVDHLIYGWLFFGIVMAALFSLGALFREPHAPRKAVELKPVGTAAVSPSRFFIVAGFATIAAAAWQPLPSSVERSHPDRPVELPALQPVGVWRAAPAPFTDWKPQFVGQVAELQQDFDAAGHSAAVYIAFYRNQREGRELVMSRNALVTKANRSWRVLESRIETVQWNGRATDARRVLIANRDGTEIAVYQLYWIGGSLTASDWVAKVLSTLSKLRGAGDDSALLVFAAPDNRPETWSSLNRFVEDVSPEIDRALAIVKRDAR
jgi:exosortase A